MQFSFYFKHFSFICQCNDFRPLVLNLSFPCRCSTSVTRTNRHQDQLTRHRGLDKEKVVLRVDRHGATEKTVSSFIVRGLRPVTKVSVEGCVYIGKANQCKHLNLTFLECAVKPVSSLKSFRCTCFS